MIPAFISHLKKRGFPQDFLNTKAIKPDVQTTFASKSRR